MATVLPLLPLLLLLFTTTTTTAISTSQLPIPSQSSTDVTTTQLDNIIEALIGAGDFQNWASVLSATDPTTFPITATLFIPIDASSTSIPSLFTPTTFSYHVVPEQLTYKQLLLFDTGSRIPTLLSRNTILVTNSSSKNYTIDDVPIVRPDLYINGAVSVHGIGSLFNFTVYGSEPFEEDPKNPVSDSEPVSSSSPPPSTVAAQLPEPSKSHQNVESHRHSDAPCSCIEFPLILTVLFAVLGSKIHGCYPFR